MADNPKQGGFIILGIIGIILLLVVIMVMYLKCRQRNAQLERSKNKGTLSINYKVNTPLPGETIDIRGKLYDVSTGSPDIPGWDQEKDVVRAEKLIGAI